MLDQVQSALERHTMVPRGALVLIAVSGGADSVALLHALLQLRVKFGLRLAVAHLHHGIRGKDADADAAVVRRLAKRLKLTYVEERADVPRQARTAGISLEMAARAARYDFFRRTAESLGATAVAVAHNADDQVETILLRIARGTGPHGLAGMSPVSQRDGLAALARGRQQPRPALSAQPRTPRNPAAARAPPEPANPHRPAAHGRRDAR
ncbi:MAG: tRNA lysidine(34) synthetase TilS [Kiritimatiellaeota bacterium]|nr:tRNA lysidine(34) synthetase TilS [Kiritimatiellota bacterium]